ncbi:hypothetical protein NDU88_002617 [Pleurodeles waltl]|uniref:Uncharacterized protein n=1 Tax=Pleurodeles waltl TaxID=8319 RepID=A0AAV7VBT5_PLEWA|nr:hypothetical protein NDU88_002617 [Pleurodeles waltl]
MGAAARDASWLVVDAWGRRTLVMADPLHLDLRCCCLASGRWQSEGQQRWPGRFRPSRPVPVTEGDVVVSVLAEADERLKWPMGGHCSTPLSLPSPPGLVPWELALEGGGVASPVCLGGCCCSPRCFLRCCGTMSGVHSAGVMLLVGRWVSSGTQLGPHWSELPGLRPGTEWGGLWVMTSLACWPLTAWGLVCWACWAHGSEGLR